MSDENFGGQKITQIFPITVGGLPDLTRKPQNFIFPYVALTALNGQDNFTETYKSVTIRSSNSDPVLRDTIPGDYVLEYATYGLDSQGNQAATYYPLQPNDRILAVSGVRQNGLHNNEFIDSSSNNFTINRTGTTTQGSVSPFEEHLSANFSGVNDYVVVEYTENLSFGANDFTVEGWIKPVNNSFQIVKSDQSYNFNLGYNIDSNNQGLILGNKDIPIVDNEIIQTIDVDNEPTAVVDLATDKIRFIADKGVSVDASYEISGISSQDIGGVAQFGEMVSGTTSAVLVFPVEYQTQIDNFTGGKRFVDVENGSNSNNGLGVNTAWQTYDYAITQTRNVTTPIMLIFMPGVYSVTSMLIGDGFTESAFLDGGFHREIVCVPGKVTFNWMANAAMRDAPLVTLTNADSKIHGAIIARNNNGRTLTYSVAFFRGFGSRGTLRNCVFREVNANNAWTLHYDNNNNFPILIDQCVFFVLDNGATPWSGGTGVDIRNSVFTRLTGSSITLTNSLTNATVDATTYRTTGAVNQGTYFGQYSWEQQTLQRDVFKLEVPLTSNILGTKQFTFTVTNAGVQTSAVVSLKGTSADPTQSLNSIVGPLTAVLGQELEYSISIDPALAIQNGTVLSYTVSGIDPASVAGSSLTGTTLVTNNRSRILIKTIEVGVTSTLSISVTVPGFGVLSTTTDLETGGVLSNAQGGVETTLTQGSTTYKVHTFTGSGSFTVTKAVSVEYLVVAGGGGASGSFGGGGGAGGYRSSVVGELSGANSNAESTLQLSPGTYSVTVGAGGNGGNAALDNPRGTNGSNSSFSSVTSLGGGTSGSYKSFTTYSIGVTGGSGGGGGSAEGSAQYAGGSGTAGQGFSGGSGWGSNGYVAGGGGGAGAVGQNAIASSKAGDGGTGISSAISGTATIRAGGGGGAAYGFQNGTVDGNGGAGGGGAGRSNVNSATGISGTANTGGGGGGGGYISGVGGAGGSGIVIVRYTETADDNGLYGPAMSEWGSTLEYRFVADDLPDGTQISFSISNLNSSDLVSNSLLSSATTLRNNIAIIKLKTAELETIKDITVVILNVNNADGSSITLTTRLQPRLKLVTNSFFNLNQWNHFAVTRSTDNLRMYINGQRKLTANIGNYSFSNDPTGWRISGPENFLQGRLADVRLLTQEAVYTQLIEPVPTSRLNSSTGTKLLTFNRGTEFTNRFQDISVVNNQITSVGATHIYDNPVGFKPYTPNQGYGSGFFGGTGNNLFINYNAAFHLSGDFTIECWFHAQSYGGMIVNFAGGFNIAWASWELVNQADGINFAASSANNGYDIGSETGATGRMGTIALNTWNHLAVTRSGNVYRGFVNGVQGYTQTTALTPYNPNARGLSIGSNYQTAGQWGVTSGIIGEVRGYISDLRIIKGQSLYNSSFVPPINPLETPAGTALHLKFDNAKVYDEIRNQNIGFNNNAVTDVTVVNEQLLSLDCTGTKYITVSLPSPARLNMAGTGIWSLEFNFLNTAITTPTAVASYGRIVGFAPWLFWIVGTSLRFYSSSNNTSWNIAENLQVIETMTLNTWYKIRLTRTSQGYQIYVNGKLELTANNSGNFFTPSNNFLSFGATTSGTTPSSIYIEDIKMWNTVNAATALPLIGLRTSEKFIGHTYPEDFFDNSELDFTYATATLGISSSSPTLQIVSTGVVQPIISYRTESRLQFVVGADGSATLVDTTPGNDPTIDRNPRPGDGADAPTLRRIWY